MMRMLATMNSQHESMSDILHNFHYILSYLLGIGIGIRMGVFHRAALTSYFRFIILLLFGDMYY